MVLGFPPIFVADTEIICRYNFVAPLISFNPFPANAPNKDDKLFRLLTAFNLFRMGGGKKSPPPPPPTSFSPGTFTNVEISLRNIDF